MTARVSFNHQRAWLLWITVGVTGVLLFLGPRLTADTVTYETYSLFRNPLTPLLLGTARALSELWYRHVFVAFHAAATVLATYALAERLGQMFSLPPWSRRLMHLSLLLPALRFSNEIGSVATTFPLSALWMATFLGLLGDPRSRRKWLFLTLWLLLATLSRSQMLILLPPTLLLAGIVVFRHRFFLPIVLCVAVMPLASILERTYHYSLNGLFERASALGPQLLTTVSFSMRESDIGCIDEGETRDYARAVHAAAQQGGLLASQRDPEMPLNHHYGTVYNQLCWGVIIGTFNDKVAIVSTDTPVTWKRMDALTTKTALQLLRCIRLTYVKNVLRVVYEMQKFFLWLVGFLLIVGIYSIRTTLGQAALAVSLLWLANILIVTGIEYPITKYTYYFDIPVVAFVFAAILSRVSEPE